MPRGQPLRSHAGVEPVLPAHLATVGKGISLRGLRAIRATIRAAFGEKRYPEVSTQEVCHSWVKELTRPAGKCRLVEVPGLLAGGGVDVGRPQYFISHAWSNPIELLFRRVFDFLASADEDTRVWLDILAVCQHADMPEQEHDVAAFADVVKACSGGTLVVLDLSRCNPATRAWCIFEWAHTLAAHGPDGLHMQLLPRERSTVFADLDVAAAECFRPEDKQMIMREVRRQHGSADAFNAKLKLQLLLEPLSQSVDLRRLQERGRDTVWEWAPVEAWMQEGCGGGGGGGGIGSRALAVVSGAGEGKSSISAELVRRLAPTSPGAGDGAPTTSPTDEPTGGVTLAYHFFKYNDQRRLDMVRVIKSLAFQLASRLQHMRSALLDLDVAEVASLSDAAVAFELLLMRPLQGLSEPVVILLDALDEADPAPPTAGAAATPPVPHEDGVGSPPSPSLAPPPVPATNGGGDSRRYPVVCGNSALQLLTRHLRRLPPCVRFFLTTRPDAASGQVVPALERAFANAGGATVLVPAQLLRGVRDGSDAGGLLVHLAVVRACLELSDEPAGRAGVRASTGGNQRLGPSATVSVAATSDSTSPPAVAALGASLSGAEQPREGPLTNSGTAPPPDAAASGTAAHASAPPAASCAAAADAASSGSGGADLSALYRVYGKVFARSYGVYDQHRRADVAELLAVLLAAQEPLPQSLVSQLGLGAAVPLLPGFGVLFFVDEHHLYMLHKSLADWLLSGAQGLAAPAERSAAAKDADVPSCEPHGAAARAPTAPSFTLDVAQGHRLLGRHLASLRHAATPPSYCLKYTVTHLAAAGAPAAALLDEVLASFDFIQAIFATGFGSQLIRALGSVSAPSRLASDALRWLRAKQHNIADNPCREVVLGTALMSPLESTLYGVAVAAAGGGWRTVRAVPTYDVWPAVVAVLRSQEDDTGAAVSGVVFSRDGRQLVSTCWINPAEVDDLSVEGDGHVLCVWDIRSGTCTAVLDTGHTEPLTCLAISHDGHMLATGSDDGTARLWDAATGQCTALFRGHTAGVTGLAFSPPEAGAPLRLVTGAADGTLRIWAASPTGQTGMAVGVASQRRHVKRFWCVTSGGGQDPPQDELGPHQPHHTTDASAEPAGEEMGDGVGECGAGSEGAACLSCLKVTSVWSGLKGVAWCPGGQRLAGAHGNDVSVWSVVTGRAMANLLGHTGTVQAVAFCPVGGGGWLASCGKDKTIRLWDTRSNECIAVLEGHTSEVTAIAWSPDGRRLASVSWDNTLRVWHTGLNPAGKGAPPGQLHGGAFRCSAVLRQMLRLTAVTFSPDGRQLAGGNADELRVWDVAACEEEHAPDPLPPPAAARPSPEGCDLSLQAGLAAPQLQPSKYEQAEAEAKAKPPTESAAAAPAAEATPIAGAGAGAHTAEVTCVQPSPDGSLIATASWDKTVRLYDSSTLRWLATLEGHSECVYGVAWEPPRAASACSSSPTRGSVRLASCGGDKTIRIWDLQLLFTANTTSAPGADDGAAAVPTAVQLVGSTTLRGHSKSVLDVAWSPAGDGQLASGAGDAHVRLWDAGTGAPTAAMPALGRGVQCVCYCPADRGATLAAAYFDRAVRIWDTAERSCLRTLQCQDGFLHHIAYTPCGTLLAAAYHKSIRLWEHASGRCVGEILGHGEVSALSFEASPPAEEGRVGTGTGCGGKDGIAGAVGGTGEREGGQGEEGGVVGRQRSVASLPRRLASASSDGTVRVWDLQTRTCVATLHGHTGSVNCVAWVRTACARGTSGPEAGHGVANEWPCLRSALVTGAEDASIRLWREHGTEGGASGCVE